MALIVVAILATTLIVVVPTWKRFQGYWNHTPTKSWRSIMLGSSFLVGAPVLLFFAALISVWIATDTWYYEFRYVLLLMLLALSLPIYFYIIPRWILRELSHTATTLRRAHRIGRTSTLGFGITYVYILFRRSWRALRHPGGVRSKGRPNLTKEIGTVSALGCFIQTIVLNLLVTMAAIPIAIGVDLGGQPQQENFEFARAMMVVMPTTFACGLGCLALSYFEELRQGVPGSKR